MNIFSLHKRQEDLAVSGQPSAVSPGATKLIAYSQVNFKRLITSNYFSVSLHQIPIQSNHSLLYPILPVFILPLHLKDAFVHKLFEVVAGPWGLESDGFRNGFWIWNPVIGDKIDDLSPIFFISISIFRFYRRFIRLFFIHRSYRLEICPKHFSIG